MEPFFYQKSTYSNHLSGVICDFEEVRWESGNLQNLFSSLIQA